MLAPSQILAPLLKPPLLSLPDSYVLICTREGEFNMEYVVQTLFACMRGCINATAPGVPILGTLDLEEHITVRRKRLWRDLVLANPPLPTQVPTYIMQADHPPAPPSVPPNKETTMAGLWDLHHLSLCRLCNIMAVRELPKIWNTTTPILKEKVQAAVKIACQ